jgi:hypothetical protein
MKVSKRRTLKELLRDKFLTGIFLEEGTLHLRLTDAVIDVDLASRDWSFGDKERTFLVFPGLLRIARVLEDESQVLLIISGAIFSSRIAIRKNKNWQILFDANFVY